MYSRTSVENVVDEQTVDDIFISVCLDSNIKFSTTQGQTWREWESLQSQQ